jgi:hypothetical protein
MPAMPLGGGAARLRADDEGARTRVKFELGRNPRDLAAPEQDPHRLRLIGEVIILEHAASFPIGPGG